MDQLNHFRKNLINLNDERALQDTFSSIIKELGYHGFDAFSFKTGTAGNVDQPDNFFINDYGIELPARYVNEGYILTDPAIMELSRAVVPFDYVAFLKQTKKTRSVLWQLGILKFQNVKMAWSVPLNSVGATQGMTVYMRGEGDELKEHFSNTRDEVYLLCSVFMEKLKGILFLSNSANKKSSQEFISSYGITDREAECLTWAAKGDTTAQISEKLNVSENTIRFHFKNAFRKLGATSRTGAINKAVQYQIIQI